MSEIWILTESRGGQGRRTNQELITAARALDPGAAVCGVVLGAPGAEAEPGLGGFDRLLALTEERLAAYSPDGWSKAIARLAEARGPAVILGSSSARGRELTGLVAARLGVPIASDCTALEMSGGRLQAERPIYAGKALATVTVDASPAVATLRPNSLPADEGARIPEVEAVALDGDYAAAAAVTDEVLSSSERPDVAEADVIVSGGRGMGGPEHFAMLEELADLLGAAVGASRAVVDAGWRPHADQVGQTGKTVSPSLYVACGISGAVQHLAGMKTSKTIVAINKDGEAPIFAVADYGVVGDVFEVVPALTEALRALDAG